MLGKQDAQHFDVLLGHKSKIHQHIHNAENMQLKRK